MNNPTQVFRQVARSGRSFTPVSRKQVAAALRRIADDLEQSFYSPPGCTWLSEGVWEAYMVSSAGYPEEVQIVVAHTPSYNK